ncbi:uncharacterized protein LOC110103206 [Dendrobium catenatum]|nr:uncharacterized protein LOC110103206 [Dendrobium catenatum]
MSSSNVWGKTTSPSHGNSRGFFNLDADSTKSPTQSFKDVLSSTTMQGDSAPKLTQSVVNGVPAILISDEDVLKLASPFQFTMVGKFALHRPNLDSIRSFFANLKLTGFYSVGLLDSRHVAIQLSNDLDYSRVFARRSYFINNCQMRILKWTPFFDVHEESLIVLIWISFPNLRLHFFNPQVLHALGSVFGRPLQTDQATASRTHPSVARVLVEVDILKKHPKEVWVGSKAFGYMQKIEFEKVSDFCSHCKIHGHAMSDCFRLHPKLKKSVKSTVEIADCPVNSISNIVPDQILSHDVMDVQVEKENGCVGQENEVEVVANSERNVLCNDSEKMPIFFVSVDSMLKISIDSALAHTKANLAINEDSDVSEEGEYIPSENKKENSVQNVESSENCEKGEYIPTKNRKEKSMQNLERGTSLPAELEGFKSKKVIVDDSFLNNVGKDQFTKVNKKKGKKNKESVSSTPFSTRAQTNAKGSHG